MKNVKPGNRIKSVLFISLFFIANCAFAGAGEIQKKSLYKRLGGVYAIATVVDDFVERALINNILNKNPAIKTAHTRASKAGLKYRVTELICRATGGPQKYTGRTMKDSHSHLNITEAEWQALLADFGESLNKFNVPEQEQKELGAILESTKTDIVTKP